MLCLPASTPRWAAKSAGLLRGVYRAGTLLAGDPDAQTAVQSAHGLRPHQIVALAEAGAGRAPLLWLEGAVTHPVSPRSRIRSRSRSRFIFERRSRVASNGERGGRAAPPVDSMGDWGDWTEWGDDEPDFILEDDGTVLEAPAQALSSQQTWQPQLSRLPSGRRLRRSALVLAVIAVVTVIVLGGPGPTAALLSPLPDAAQARELLRHLDRGQSWGSFDAPSAAGENPNVRVVPASGATNMAYACWVNVSRPQLDLALGPLSLAAFDVARRQWHLLATPTASAVRCDFAADATDPHSALLMLWNVSEYDADCPLPTLYLTHDQGASWTSVAWSPAALPDCDLTFRLVAGHLYVFSSDSLLAPSALPPRTAGQIIVTGDQGRTWRAVDTGLAGLASLEVVAFRPGGHILAQAEQQISTTTYSLWQTGNDGAAWQYLGPLPGTAPRVFASSDPGQVVGGWGPLYLVSTTPLGTYGPAGSVYLATARVPSAVALALAPTAAVMPVLRWLPIPPPDVSDRLTGRPFGASLGDAAEGPNGAFLYLQPVTNTTPYIIVPQFHVWIWHPAAAAWTMGHYSIPPNATLQGVSWSGERMTVWLTTFGGGLTAHVKVQMSSLGADASG